VEIESSILHLIFKIKFFCNASISRTIAGIQCTNHPFSCNFLEDFVCGVDNVFFSRLSIPLIDGQNTSSMHVLNPPSRSEQRIPENKHVSNIELE
jgi:hypothetical protein